MTRLILLVLKGGKPGNPPHRSPPFLNIKHLLIKNRNLHKTIIILKTPAIFFQFLLTLFPKRRSAEPRKRTFEHTFKICDKVEAKNET